MLGPGNGKVVVIVRDDDAIGSLGVHPDFRIYCEVVGVASIVSDQRAQQLQNRIKRTFDDVG